MSVSDILIMLVAVIAVSAVTTLFIISMRENSEEMKKMDEMYRDWRKSDADAIRSDWEAVGKDMYACIDQFKDENNL